MEKAVTGQFPSLRPLLQVHSHRSGQHEAARSHRRPRRAHTFPQAYSHWQHPSTSQRDPHRCLRCGQSYGFVHEAKTLAGGGVIPSAALTVPIPSHGSAYNSYTVTHRNKGYFHHNPCCTHPSPLLARFHGSAAHFFMASTVPELDMSHPAG